MKHLNLSHTKQSRDIVRTFCGLIATKDQTTHQTNQVTCPACHSDSLAVKIRTARYAS